MKKSKGPKVKLSYSKCIIVTNLPMHCPLCGVKLKSMVKHECSKPEMKR